MKTAGTGDQSDAIGVPNTTRMPERPIAPDSDTLRSGIGTTMHALVVAGGYPVLREIPTRLISPMSEIHLITGPESVCITGAPGDFVSLVPLTDHVDGITTTGLAYPLHGERLAWGTSRGISNELRHATATVSATAGRLLVILQR
ncbi:MAG: hypothetical protein EB140_14230, partial [Proteobacteria bacterium]|nr:hypothetical protein [Pseudomonadota bacterium]